MAEKAREGLSDDDIRRELQETHGWTFEPPKYSETPTPRSEYVERCRDEVLRLRNHLVATYIIRDNFGNDHVARRKFLTENGFSTFQKKYNKLKGNNILGVILTMEDVIEKLRKSFPEASGRLDAIFDEETVSKVGSYNDRTQEEKIAFAKEIDEMVFKFLEALSQ